MAGDEAAGFGEIEPFAFQHPYHRQARRHQRRLGVLGEVEVMLGAFEHQPAQALAQGVIDLGEHIAGGRVGLGEFAAHADGLGALSGEEESLVHGGFLPGFVPGDQA